MISSFLAALRHEWRVYRIRKLERLQQKLTRERGRLRRKALAYQAEREQLERE